MKILQCPRCGSEQFTRERRPNGNTTCLSCKYKCSSYRWDMCQKHIAVTHRNAVELNNLNEMAAEIYQNNVKVGWWGDVPSDRSKAECIALIHSEVSEALEGLRKDSMDDHLPHRKGVEVELADTIIRILDLAGHMQLDLTGAMIEKIEYNKQRADHKLENRSKEGGKKF